MLPPQYDYAQPLILDNGLEPSTSSARHVPFPSQYTIPLRNQLEIGFPAQSPMDPRLPPATTHSGQSVDYRYSAASERRLPGGPSHDSSYTRTSGNSSALPMDSSDHKSSLVSSGARPDTTPAPQASSSAQVTRKEKSSVVIACRQWYVHYAFH